MKTPYFLSYLKVLSGFVCAFSLALSSCAQPGQQGTSQRPQREDTASLFLFNNQQALLPLQELQTQKIACISFQTPFKEAFTERLSRYAPLDSYAGFPSPDSLKVLSERVKLHKLLIIPFSANQRLSPAFLDFIRQERNSKDVVLCGIGPLDSLADLDSLQIPLIWTRDSSRQGIQQAASAIFGGRAITQTLPRSISPHFPKGSGFNTLKTRLAYGAPEDLGIPSNRLRDSIDHIAEEAIREKATPGAVVMVVKDGTVIFEKAYGTHTYGQDIPTKTTDLFDLASVSKITATTLAVMHLYEEHQLDLEQTIGHYLFQARGTNKESIQLKEVMLHQAGFIPFIPFYKELKPGDIASDSSASHSVKLADHRFLRSHYYENVMWPAMLRSPLKNRGQYVYSDISMYVMKEIVEQQSSQPIDQYVQEQFYRPLGMYRTGYKPRERFSKEEIVPTEQDTYFRNTLLQGYVHDQGAAMAGGVAGHAGVFSTANDLAIYGQLLLNQGSYGGQAYFRPETVKRFTSRQSAVSRRGWGFDRTDPDPKKAYPSALASSNTFGHTGYTGTCIWIDPEQQLVYIFLSNRVNPTVTDKLSTLNIRSRIQDAIYEALPLAKANTLHSLNKNERN